MLFCFRFQKHQTQRPVRELFPKAIFLPLVSAPCSLTPFTTRNKHEHTHDVRRRTRGWLFANSLRGAWFGKCSYFFWTRPPKLPFPLACYTHDWKHLITLQVANEITSPRLLLSLALLCLWDTPPKKISLMGATHRTFVHVGRTAQRIAFSNEGFHQPKLDNFFFY